MNVSDIQQFCAMHGLTHIIESTFHADWTRVYIYAHTDERVPLQIGRMSLNGGKVEHVKWYLWPNNDHSYLLPAWAYFVQHAAKLTKDQFAEAREIAKRILEDELAEKQRNRSLLKQKKRPKLAPVTTERVFHRACQIVLGANNECQD